MQKDRERRWQKRRGSATLEFGIVVIPLLSMALLCVDFGRFAHRYIAVTNAARAGASYAIMHPVTVATKPAWDANILQAVNDELSTNNWFNASDVVLATPINQSDGGNNFRRVTIDVSYPFDPLINWPFLPSYNDARNIRRVVVMRGIR